MHQLNLYLDVYDDLTASAIRWLKRVDEIFVLHFSFVNRFEQFPKKNLQDFKNIIKHS